MTGLEEFINDSTNTDNTKTVTDTAAHSTGNSESDDMGSNTTTSTRSSISIDYDWTKHGTPTDHTKQRNICPECMTSGPKVEDLNRYWSCDNESCGVVKYGSGWFEQKTEEWSSHEDKFLTSIDWPATMDRVDKRINA